MWRSQSKNLSLRCRRKSGKTKKDITLITNTYISIDNMPTDGDWDYSESGGEATIYLYMGEDTALVIPSTLGGYPVVAVDAWTFFGGPYTSITFSSGVRSLGAYACGECNSLTTVTFEGSIASIYVNAFLNDGALMNVNFKGMTAPTFIQGSIFGGCPAGMRGHAYQASNFPTPGNTFYELTMGDYLEEEPAETVVSYSNIVYF